MIHTSPPSPPPLLRFRCRSFLALVLSPTWPLEAWLAGLDEVAARTPGFFAGRPAVLDGAAVPPEAWHLETLLAELGKRGIRVMAVEGAAPDSAAAAALPALTGAWQAGTIEVTRPPAELPAAEAPASEAAPPTGADTGAAATDEATAATPSVTPEPQAHPMPVPTRLGPASLMLSEPVRSGQSIIFPDGDVTVMGSVASGAEVIAGGSVHIYGTLRGRALAGVTGNASARIFCRRHEAELIAIDGLYSTDDTMDERLRGKPVQAWLEGDSVRMALLD